MWSHKAMDEKDISSELLDTPVVISAHTCGFILPWISQHAHAASRRCLTMGSSQEAFTKCPRLTLTKSNKRESQTELFWFQKLKKKMTEPEIKGKTVYKKNESYNTEDFFFCCTEKGTLLSSITVPEDWTPLISKPANEHDPEPVPFINAQHHFFKTHLNFISPLSSCSTVSVNNYILCNTRCICFCIRKH